MKFWESTQEAERREGSEAGPSGMEPAVRCHWRELERPGEDCRMENCNVLTLLGAVEGMEWDSLDSMMRGGKGRGEQGKSNDGPIHCMRISRF